MQKPIHAQLFLDWPHFTRKDAHQLVTQLVENSPLAIEKFGYSEQTNKKWTAKSIGFITEGLADYPLYRSGEVFLQARNNSFLIHLNNPRTDLPSIYLYIDPNYFFKETSYNKVIAYFNTLCEQLPVIFARISSDEEHRYRHLLVTKTANGGQTEQMKGLNLKSGLPGLYSYTFFSTTLLKSLDIASFNPLSLSSGKIIQLATTPADFEEPNLQLADEFITKLNKDLFFDKNRTVKSTLSEHLETTIQMVSMRSFNQLPNHGGIDMNAINYQQRPQPELLDKYNLSLENSYTNSLLEKIEQLLHTEYNAQNTDDLIVTCGQYLGELLAKHYKVTWDDEFPYLLNFDKYEPAQVNPYFIVSLVIEDNLSIADFDQTIQNLYI